MSEIWGAIGAVSGAIAAVVVIVGGFYAHRQLQEAKAMRNATLLLELRDRYHSSEMRAIRARLLDGALGSPRDLNPESFSEQDFHHFWELLDQLEFIGLLIRQNLMDVNLLRGMFHRSPPRVWKAVEPYVLSRRSLVPKECQNLEYLADRY